MENPRKIWNRAKFSVIGINIIAARATYLLNKNARPHNRETIPITGNMYPVALTAEIKANPSDVNIIGSFTALGKTPNFEREIIMNSSPVRMRIVW